MDENQNNGEKPRGERGDVPSRATGKTGRRRRLAAMTTAERKAHRRTWRAALLSKKPRVPKPAQDKKDLAKADKKA